MAKAYDYVITLKQRNFKAFDVVSQLLIVISLVVFAYNAYLFPNVRIQYGILGAMIVASWIYTSVKARRADLIIYYRFTLTLTSIGWFFQSNGNPWIGGLLILTAFLERQVKFPEEVGINEEGVTFNSFPKKEVAWKNLTNVVLKFGMLTVDMNNNKLFQKETESDIDPKIENEFNAFCTTMLNKERTVIHR